MSTAYEFHPLANIFPMITGKAFAELVEDINRHKPLNAGLAVEHDDVAWIFHRLRINEVRFPLAKMRRGKARHGDKRCDHYASEDHGLRAVCRAGTGLASGLDATVASVAIRAIRAASTIMSRRA